MSAGQQQQQRRGAYIRTICWYLLFGAVHEAAHIIVAALTGLSEGILRDGVFLVVVRAVLGRRCVIPALQVSESDNAKLAASTVRHAGWVTSVVAAALIYRAYKKVCRNAKNATASHIHLRNEALFAACITAIEAISTDLLGHGTGAILPLPFLPTSTHGFNSHACTLFCGNFGLLLLNNSWISADGGKSALDIIETMVGVTMMRGAQSGGVVSFIKSKWPSKNDLLLGIRSRVVNKKRTDLSKIIREKLHREVFWSFRSPSLADSDFVQTFVGHTRFATTSKATLDGTHPHQWTPPTYRRMYNFNLRRIPSKVEKEKDADFPRNLRVENFITHNGDFDFYCLNGVSYELETIQKWLVIATEAKMPSSVDSAAIAGMIDLIRTQGCFGLSARFAICLGLPRSKISSDPYVVRLPSYQDYEQIGMVFEEVLDDMLGNASLEDISAHPILRQSSSRRPTFKELTEQLCQRRKFAARVTEKITGAYDELMRPFAHYIQNDEERGSDIHNFVTVTIDAFFDNDLLNATKIFMKNAKGSFGLCITSSLDAHRQICLAARGQTMSVAFYPTQGIILYGSEQGAVKAGIGQDIPGAEQRGASCPLQMSSSRHLDVNDDDQRLDLDDLGGEICLLDWSGSKFTDPAISLPNRHLTEHKVMKGAASVFLLQESKASKPFQHLYKRMTRLTRNQFIKPLQPESDDLVLRDIQDIPRVCRAIQDDWNGINRPEGAMSLNRLTAWNLTRCLRKKLEALDNGAIEMHGGAVDILLTGCEVSLWLAEQFASDIKKCFPKLRVMAVSSNKILGLYGQEVSLSATGYPMNEKTHTFRDAIVIIVSHSGGTFSPLACSNLFQSKTTSVFVVTSEWDTQIGKQLRKMNSEDEDRKLMFNSCIFSTEVGMRPAEPCSVSVAGTHQLLTNIFEHIAIVILSNERFRRVSGALITEYDLQVLERCNQDNIKALESIVGVDSRGDRLTKEATRVEKELRQAGDIWSEHILENAKAYIMTFVYIMASVISGYPICTLVASIAGLRAQWALYIIKAIDALIYFFLPQINVIILRLLQRRTLRHRMVGRTVVVGDIPWVSQAAEAFLSKIFACSYSIAGLNVHSGNPEDHFVHRHTHRVVRGSLIVCGRPDGRLSALSSSEGAVCLSVNQASSIQSIGGRAETITIGHNHFKLPLSAVGIFLDRNRPLFLCEHMLDTADQDKGLIMTNTYGEQTHRPSLNIESSPMKRVAMSMSSRFLYMAEDSSEEENFRGADTRRGINGKPKLSRGRSSAALLGAYKNLERRTQKELTEEELNRTRHLTYTDIIEKEIHEKKWSNNARKLFELLDVDKEGTLSMYAFVSGYHELKPNLSHEQLLEIFREADTDNSGNLSFDEFFDLVRQPHMEAVAAVMPQPCIRDSRGLIQVQPSEEDVFGENMLKAENVGKTISVGALRSQHMSQELYESRVASLQRFVAMTVMFHQMGSRVQSFFPRISFGLLGYRMDRTHSIMRIATTASPVGGADLRERKRTLQVVKKTQHSVNVITAAWLKYKQKKEEQRIKELEVFHSIWRLSSDDADGKDAPRVAKKEVFSPSLRRSTVI